MVVNEVCGMVIVCREIVFLVWIRVLLIIFLN